MGLKNDRREPNPAVFVIVENQILPKLLPLLREFETFLRKLGITPKKWFLYGSFACGTARLSSDIDVGVVLPASVKLNWFYEARDAFLETQSDICGFKIEITVYNQLPTTEWIDNFRDLILG